MKTFIKLHLLLLLAATSVQTAAQTGIKYGSNNGKYVAIKNTKLYYEEYGKGTPLLLLHGFMGSISNYENTIPELSKMYKVIAVDAPGHGRSEHTDTISYQLMADYFSRMIDILKLDSVYVIGYSDGGQTAAILAADRQDKVKKTVAVSAGYNTDGYIPIVAESYNMFTAEFVEVNMKEWLDEYKKITPQKDKWQKLFADNKKMYYSSKVVIPESKLKSISKPVLLVYGDKDAVTLEHAVQMHRLIKGSQLSVLPATTHFVFMEKPEQVHRLILDFLQ